jgi:hypothetical protein
MVIRFTSEKTYRIRLIWRKILLCQLIICILKIDIVLSFFLHERNLTLGNKRDKEWKPLIHLSTRSANVNTMIIHFECCQIITIHVNLIIIRIIVSI